jgi:hypothetical protein
MLLLLWQPQYLPAAAQQPAIETAWQPADPLPTLGRPFSLLWFYTQGLPTLEVDFPPTGYSLQPYEVPGLYQYDKTNWILIPVPGGAAGYSLAQNPPFKGLTPPWLSAVEQAWQPPDPPPTLPFLTAAEQFVPPVVVTFVPYAPAWLSAVVAAWAPIDPTPSLPVTWRGPPGWSVDSPPRRTAGDVTVQTTWIPPDPLPTLEVKWAGRPGWSVDQPQPYARKALDIQAAYPPWIPPDPPPTLTVQWMGRPGWSVDQPPHVRPATPWPPDPDPLPTLTTRWMGRPGWSVDVPPRWRAAPLPPPPDPDPLQQRLVATPQPPPVIVAYVPFAEAWLGTVLSSWQPADPTPTLERNLNPQLTSNPPNNPPFQVSGLLGNVTAWLPGDPQPTVPRYGLFPATPALVQPFAGATWVNAVLAAWTVVDPFPVAPRGWLGRPGWSVDSPPALRRGADAVPTWQPVDTLPELPPSGLGKPGWSVDNPPRFRLWLPPDPIADSLPTIRLGVPQAPAVVYVPFSQVWLSAVGVAWQPPDPLPTLPRFLNPLVTGVRVDAPPIILTGQFGNISDWLFPDPLPTLIRLGPVLPPVIIVTPPAPLGELGVFVHRAVSFYIGDDWIIYGALIDEQGNPLDPSDATSITWKLDDETETINYFTLTLGAGISFVSVPNSIVPGIVIVLPATSSATLVPQTYRNQLRAVINGVTSTFWQGDIQALQQLA